MCFFDDDDDDDDGDVKCQSTPQPVRDPTQSPQKGGAHQPHILQLWPDASARKPMEVLAGAKGGPSSNLRHGGPTLYICVR